MPEVVAISAADIRAALAQGIADFARAPAYGLVISALFVLIGQAIAFLLVIWRTPWLIYPFAIGFPLIGPFAAVGLYEVSRRLERGAPLSFVAVFSVVWAQRRRELALMAFVMLFVFWVWMYQVRLLMALFLGRASFSTFDRFFSLILETPQGWTFLAAGHLVGAAMALGLYTITVVSIPLLLDRERDIVTALVTSVRVILASPGPMLGWGTFVWLAVLAASLPFFLGLLAVLPVLGHTTWHLYRRGVAREHDDA
jgi:uncharacterized membrane protein